MQRQTTMMKKGDITRNWYVVDAEGLTLGRMATQIAAVITGKNKPTFTPNLDCGDYVYRQSDNQVLCDDCHRGEYCYH
jgi:large subunit ribosomal protein L13